MQVPARRSKSPPRHIGQRSEAEANDKPLRMGDIRRHLSLLMPASRALPICPRSCCTKSDVLVTHCVGSPSFLCTLLFAFVGKLFCLVFSAISGSLTQLAAINGPHFWQPANCGKSAGLRWIRYGHGR